MALTHPNRFRALGGGGLRVAPNLFGRATDFPCPATSRRHGLSSRYLAVIKFKDANGPGAGLCLCPLLAQLVAMHGTAGYVVTCAALHEVRLVLMPQ